MTAQPMMERGNPPPKRNLRYDWYAIAEKLRQDPGEWFHIFDHDRTSLAVQIRNGDVIPLRPTDGFEVTTRKNIKGPPRTCSMWLRYNPERDESK